MTEVFIGQPLASPGSATYTPTFYYFDYIYLAKLNLAPIVSMELAKWDFGS